MKTAILHQPTRLASITRELAQASNAGLEPVVLLGAEQLVFHGSSAKHFEPQRRAMERAAVELAAALVARDHRSPDELLTGVCYGIDARTDRPAGSFVIQMTSLEDTARAWARRLRSGAGLHVRRAQANRLAETLEALTARSTQPVREVAR